MSHDDQHSTVKEIWSQKWNSGVDILYKRFKFLNYENMSYLGLLFHDGELTESIIEKWIERGEIVGQKFTTSSPCVEDLICMKQASYKPKQVELLIVAGANPNSCTTSSSDAYYHGVHNTILHLAAHHFDVGNIALLIAAGAFVDSRARREFLWRTDSIGVQSKENMLLALALLLVSGGTSTSDVTNNFGVYPVTPLDVALYHFHIASGFSWQQVSPHQIIESIDDVTRAKARKLIQKAHFALVKKRATAICIALQELELDANRMCFIVTEACSPNARFIWHLIWNLVVKVKHFCPSKKE